MDNSKRKFLKRAGQSSAMLILFAYGGGKLLAANNPMPSKIKLQLVLNLARRM